MTNISRGKVSSKDYATAYRQLVKAIAKLQEGNAQLFIEDLLTESEQIMLVKRFAAIFMFQDNHSPYRVSQTINVSESTAQRLFSQYNKGHFANLLGCIHKKQKNEFIAFLSDFIAAKSDMRARARLLKRAL